VSLARSVAAVALCVTAALSLTACGSGAGSSPADAGKADAASPKFVNGTAKASNTPADTSTTNITINGTRAGAAFQGIGAVAGGGGNARLLIDYPQPQRTQILDYLFKPGYGATIQMLKLEIGGDANSTDGAEPSIESNEGKVNCHAGYEWWLARQAVALNPSIKLYGLQWTAPGWVGNGGTNIWTRDDVNYVISWLNCAKRNHLTISYLGGWDEKRMTSPAMIWYEDMRTALDNAGYAKVQIVANDGSPGDDWSVAGDMAAAPAFNSTVAIVGEHDVCQYPTTGYTCTGSSAASGLGKPLWASELGGMDPNENAAALVRSVSNGYIRAGLTGYLVWPLVGSMPAGLPHEDDGLVTADQPWTGNYTVNKMTWAIAQTTQFVGQGWRYVRGGSGTLGDSGSYVTYENPARTLWTMVAQNTGSAATNGKNITSHPVRVSVRGGLADSVIHVWATNLWSGASSQWFMRESSINATGGGFTDSIPPGYVVTFTTNHDGQKRWRPGTAVPAAKPLPLPYANSLGTNDGSDEPPMLAAQDGAFEVVPCRGNISGQCTEQVTPQKPITWENGDKYPYAIVGEGTWANYVASVNTLFTRASASGGIIGRFSNSTNGNADRYAGYVFDVSESGTWELLDETDTADLPAVLASGAVPALGLNTWNRLGLSMRGNSVRVILNNVVLKTVANSDHLRGSIGIEGGITTKTWPNNQYSDLTVTPLSPAGSEK
jgi:hypothetical protein